MSDSLQPHGLYSPWNSPGWNTGVGSLSFLQGIFPSQELNQGLLHCRQILYPLSYEGSPKWRYWLFIYWTAVGSILGNLCKTFKWCFSFWLTSLCIIGSKTFKWCLPYSKFFIACKLLLLLFIIRWKFWRKTKIINILLEKI